MRPFVKVVCRTLPALLVWGLLAAPATTQETPAVPATAPETPAAPSPATPAADLPPVAVTIDGDPIFVGEIENFIAQTKKSGNLPQGDLDVLKATLLTQLVDRRLAAHYLARDETLIKPGEVENMMKMIEAAARKEEGPSQQGKSFDQLLREKGVTTDTFRHLAIWQMASERYLERHLADALEGVFNEHRQELDGTELRASQILLRADRFDEKPAQTEARAARLRAEIEAGKLDFAAAARKYSVAPSRDQGGDMGFLPRNGVMLNPFSAALFKLKKGEISPPVSTPYGTHLITVTDVKPGSRQWTEVIPQIKPLAAAQVMAEITEKERATAKVEYTGKSPYYKPGTQELVRARP